MYKHVIATRIKIKKRVPHLSNFFVFTESHSAVPNLLANSSPSSAPNIGPFLEWHIKEPYIIWVEVWLFSFIKIHLWFLKLYAITIPRRLCYDLGIKCLKCPCIEYAWTLWEHYCKLVELLRGGGVYWEDLRLLKHPTRRGIEES